MKLSASFRARLALYSAILAGSALVGFGATSWWLIYTAKQGRLDEAIQAQLPRPSRPQWCYRWRDFETLLPDFMRTDVDVPVLLLVTDRAGRQLYRSADWPQGLSMDRLWPPAPVAPPSARPSRSVAPSASPCSGDADINDKVWPKDLWALKSRVSVPRFATFHTTTASWRIGAGTFSQARVAIAVDLRGLDREMGAVRGAFLVSIVIVLVLIAGGAWGLSGSALRPLHQLTEAIRQVTAQGLDRRVPIDTSDVEFVALIQVFNQMLENLERSFKQASRFSADAAHELKTPLAILQGELEQALLQAEAGSQLQQDLSSMLDEVRRLTGIVRKLLLLSLADAGKINLLRTEVDLSGLIEQMLEDLELMAPHLEVRTHVDGNLQVWGDRDLLTQVLQNLVDNAAKYNLSDGWIKIVAKRQGQDVITTVTNPSAQALSEGGDRLFDRFYRGDPARTRQVEGTGLGLSLAREIVRAHQGELTLHGTTNGIVTLVLKLPQVSR
ncbi:MAG TPA: ATP-binding protein [Stenomitos sp.]